MMGSCVSKLRKRELELCLYNSQVSISKTTSSANLGNNLIIYCQENIIKTNFELVLINEATTYNLIFILCWGKCRGGKKKGRNE